MIPATYYRSRLSEEEKIVYRIVTRALLEHRSRIQFCSPLLETDALSRVIKAVHWDHPELFFVNFWEGVNITVSPLLGISLHFRLLLDEHSSRCVYRTLQERALVLRRKLQPDMSMDQKYALVIHEITGSTEYLDSGSAFWDHTAAGPILRHSAVCEGIAKLFLFFCQRLELPCALITGTVHDVPHAWNMVERDGELRYVDVTGLLNLPALYTLFPNNIFQTELQIQRSGYVLNRT